MSHRFFQREPLDADHHGIHRRRIPGGEDSPTHLCFAITMPSSSTSDSWWATFSKFQDDQRLERLQQCRQLQNVLANCEATTAAAAATATATANNDAIEEFSDGIRMMKYFGWRGILKQEQGSDQPAKQLPVKLREAIASSCARERHAMWACRGVAVGCGKELAALKKGFDDHGPLVILHESQTAYEESYTKNKNNKSKKRIPCAKLQTTLGACVQRGASNLLERTRQRNEEVVDTTLD